MMLGKSRAMGKPGGMFGGNKKRLMMRDPMKGAVLKEVEPKDDLSAKFEKSKQVSMEIRSSAESIHAQLQAAKEAMVSSDESVEQKKKATPKDEEKPPRKTRKTTRKQKFKPKTPYVNMVRMDLKKGYQ